jgi:hypothetical protein
MKVRWQPPPRAKAALSFGASAAAKFNGEELITHECNVGPGSLKYTLKPKEISWESHDTVFKGSIGFELEVIRNDDRNKSQQAEQVVSFDMVLVGVAVAILTADLIKNIVTLGAGALESPLSYAAAMALLMQAGVTPQFIHQNSSPSSPYRGSRRQIDI